MALLLLVDLRMGLFHQTAADPHNPVYAALQQHSPGRLLELPVFEAGSQSASVYLYYLMQAPHEHPSGYSTTAPLAADRRLRELQKTPCRYLRPLGVRELVTHYDAKNPCGGRLIARSGRIAAYPGALTSRLGSAASASGAGRPGHTHRLKLARPVGVRLIGLVRLLRNGRAVLWLRISLTG